ncbi:MAG: PAS domain-containing protein [Deltaproteobacteria bacterium]|nr:PAS domain-containing protein [Deltaproteobacteria bacterium]
MSVSYHCNKNFVICLQPFIKSLISKECPVDNLLTRAFNAMPSPVFIVDEDVRIFEYNTAAAALLSTEKTDVLKLRGGEVLHCIHHHEAEDGCGRTPACADCVIRNSVKKACQGGSVVRARQKMELVRDEKIIEVYVLITASPFSFQDSTYAILVLEDISELIELRQIIPICAACKQIRTDENYWIQVESFFKERLDLDFTHGLCPSCRDNYLDELKTLKQEKL